ncbi:MAG: hypothetical protein SZ59_C0001G0143 [candidate division TM6 bacterium GW2011_GWF2_28_16]|nr:MAG: hypothetical protein SZ59_C0001G0143 [candidate division TM6 bacterium GW2011_GWF2_28_16]
MYKKFYLFLYIFIFFLKFNNIFSMESRLEKLSLIANNADTRDFCRTRDCDYYLNIALNNFNNEIDFYEFTQSGELEKLLLEFCYIIDKRQDLSVKFNRDFYSVVLCTIKKIIKYFGLNYIFLAINYGCINDNDQSVCSLVNWLLVKLIAAKYDMAIKYLKRIRLKYIESDNVFVRDNINNFLSVNSRLLVRCD